MWNDHYRFAALERQLRNTRRMLAALFGVVVLACTVAAGPALVALVTKGVEVRNPDGKTVIELKDNGNATFGGTLTVNGKEVANKFVQVAALDAEMVHAKEFVTLKKGSVPIRGTERRKYLVLFTTAGIRSESGSELEFRLLSGKVELDKAYLRETGDGFVGAKAITLSWVGELAPNDVIEIQTRNPDGKGAMVGSYSIPKLSVIQID